jgi:hypothetical protein
MPLTDAQIANAIFNESRSLSGAHIQRARVNIAPDQRFTRDRNLREHLWPLGLLC